MNIQDRLNQLSIEIGEWAAINFPVHLPRMGVLEEVGEMTHCILKRFQKIRGFDNPEHFKKEFGDAIADVGIYLLHDVFMVQIVIIDDPMQSEYVDDFDLRLTDQNDATDFLGKLSEDASWFLDGQDYNAASIELHDAILQKMCAAAKAEGMDFMQLVEKTWAKVSKRDWVAQPEKAGIMSEQTLPPVPPGNEPIEGPVSHK